MVSAEEQDRHKRLLLNDPDVINSRLINLEKSMQDVVRLTQQQQTMQSTIAQLQNALLNDRGSTYIRWGRKQCSGVNTEMLYTGFAAGQEHYHSQYYGGPANMLCLPNNPEISNRTAAHQVAACWSEQSTAMETSLLLVQILRMSHVPYAEAQTLHHQ
ncbi:unnamed protein product [Mytilus edulis]|uniref:Uncharacterized protein n=1 Tax=Mytilus edulis TaxID=6550 RepID=A0A8S3U9B4_MYTED|nr:unnamed protein product [Mytilus edulis]